MKLGELYDQLGELIERHEGTHRNPRELDVVFRIQNFSIGPSATANITGWSLGFDWNNGDIFLSTDVPLYHAIPYTRDQMKANRTKTLGHIEKLGYLPRQRKDCWEDGYKHGFDIGVQSRFAETHPPLDGEVPTKEL